MRRVRIPPNSKPPKTWLDRAELLAEQLEKAADDQTRIAVVFANRKLWRDPELLDWLTNLHHRKCWYSEARESTSSYHVDHFRPKGKARQGDGQPRAGYWWLAFKWDNYRLCGQLLNVKKRDFFPVKHPAIAQPTVPDTLEFENCILLDPLKDEARLVSFERQDDGDCIAVCSPGSGESDIERVAVTIDILGLNRLKALNKNRADIWDKCLDRIRDYRNAEIEAINYTRAALQAVAATALAELCWEEAEFSSVAEACVSKMAPLPLQHLVRDRLLDLARRRLAA